MPLDAWLPVGHKLPDDARVRVAVYEGANWQVYDTQGGGAHSLPRTILLVVGLIQGSSRRDSATTLISAARALGSFM